MFLDIVVTKDKKIHIIDKVELEMASNENIIDKEEYNKAIKTADNLYEYLRKNKNKLINFCNNSLREMIKDKDI